MRRDHVQLEAPAIGGAGDVIAYGHFGRPVLAFPAEQGRAWDFESNGVLDAVRPLIDAGRLKLYCVDSHDAASWSDRSISMEDPTRRYAAYESWILDQVVPFVYADCAGAQEMVAAGCGLGAFHAVSFALKRADTFPIAIGLSGTYEADGGGSAGARDDAPYADSPVDYVAALDGDQLDWLRSRLHVVLVCGQDESEQKTGALESAQRLARLLADKGLRHELDLRGDGATHGWESWGAQLAHHLPRFC
jgi:esterase/lipase superfamily enzyme